VPPLGGKRFYYRFERFTGLKPPALPEVLHSFHMKKNKTEQRNPSFFTGHTKSNMT
jgi:hypothetical protein